jgi:hypothetical protein
MGDFVKTVDPVDVLQEAYKNRQNAGQAVVQHGKWKQNYASCLSQNDLVVAERKQRLAVAGPRDDASDFGADHLWLERHCAIGWTYQNECSYCAHALFRGRAKFN